MRLIFDNNFKFRGFSDSLENVVIGTLVESGSIILHLIFMAFAPLSTLLLIRFFKRHPESSSSRWNPLNSPIPFSILNLIWVLMAIMIATGNCEGISQEPKSNYKQWDFTSGEHYNPIGRQRDINFK